MAKGKKYARFIKIREIIKSGNLEELKSLHNEVLKEKSPWFKKEKIDELLKYPNYIFDWHVIFDYQHLYFAIDQKQTEIFDYIQYFLIQQKYSPRYGQYYEVGLKYAVRTFNYTMINHILNTHLKDNDKFIREWYVLKNLPYYDIHFKGNIKSLQNMAKKYIRSKHFDKYIQLSEYYNCGLTGVFLIKFIHMNDLEKIKYILDHELLKNHALGCSRDKFYLQFIEFCFLRNCKDKIKEYILIKFLPYFKKERKHYDDINYEDVFKILIENNADIKFLDLLDKYLNSEDILEDNLENRLRHIWRRTIDLGRESKKKKNKIGNQYFKTKLYCDLSKFTKYLPYFKNKKMDFENSRIIKHTLKSMNEFNPVAFLDFLRIFNYDLNFIEQKLIFNNTINCDMPINLQKVINELHFQAKKIQKITKQFLYRPQSKFMLQAQTNFYQNSQI